MKNHKNYFILMSLSLCIFLGCIIWSMILMHSYRERAENNIQIYALILAEDSRKILNEEPNCTDFSSIVLQIGESKARYLQTIGSGNWTPRTHDMITKALRLWQDANDCIKRKPKIKDK
jgi:hypothetical protein